MPALPAITADSLGNRQIGWLPALTPAKQTGSERESVAVWLEGQRRDPPGQTVSNRHAQAAAYTNGVYIAVRTIMTAVAGASFVVSRRREPGLVSKSQGASAAGVGESDWAPAPPDSPPAKLFEHINERDTVADFLSELVMCDRLFGLTVIWAVPNRGGTPAELWNLRANYLTSIPIGPQYPSGAWRYTMPQPMLWPGSGGMLVIPGEQTVVRREPHPRFPWDGYSPLEGGAKMADFLNSVIDSRQNAMDHGFSPDTIVKISGATEDQLRQFMGRLRERNTGGKGQRVIGVDGEQIDVQSLNTDPDKMAYDTAYTQGVAAVLALFGVPSSAAGLTDANSYSSFYAAARQFRENTLNGWANSFSQTLTKHLVWPHWGNNYRLEIKLPPLMDPDLREKQNGTLLQADAIKVNELRASYDLPPLADGDVTPGERASKRQQAEQQTAMQQQMAQQEAMGGGMAGPTTAPGDVDTPDVGGASEGSLPGAVQKSLRHDWRAQIDALVAEVLA